MLGLSRVEEFIRPLRRMVTGRADVYRVQSSSLRTGVKEIVTLLVKSKTGGKAILYRMFEGPRDCLHAAGDPRSYGVGDLPSRLNQQSHDLLYTGGELPRLT